MNAFKVFLFLVGSVLLGIVGAIAARSLFAGIMLAGLVFGGWFLWRLFKLQNEKDGLEENKEESVGTGPNMQEVNNNQSEQVQQPQQ